MEDDIASIVGIKRLRLAESLCEGSYPRWSAKASNIIRESEIGSTGQRDYEEIIRDGDDADLVAPSVRRKSVITTGRNREASTLRGHYYLGLT